MAGLARIDWYVMVIYTILNTCGALIIYVTVLDPMAPACSQRLMRDIIVYGYLQTVAGFAAGYGALRTIVDTAYLERVYDIAPAIEEDTTGV